MVEILVGDTGPGIPKELCARIFDPFVTTKPKGLGLGLAICHRIVEEHRGSIQVESQVGKGTTFALYLPIQR
jgi:signal transduction histidine kinase